MADVRKAIRTVAVADETLAGLVGTRVRWVKLDQGETMPAVLLTLGPGEDPQNMSTTPTHRWNTFQIDSFGDTLTSAAAVDAAVEGALNGYSGTSESVTIQHIELEPPTDVPWDDAGETFRVMRRGTVKYDI